VGCDSENGSIYSNIMYILDIFNL